MLLPLTADAVLPPTAVERAWRALVPPRHCSSAEALYALMPRQRGGQLPLVDVPYHPQSEEHWAEAARIADYVAHLPTGTTDAAAPTTAATAATATARVLDIGPGDGWPAIPVALALPGVQVIGVDPATQRCVVSSGNAARLGAEGTRFLRGDAAALPFADASFDLVTAASALEEADGPLAVFGELRRVLRPGGVLRASYQDWALPDGGWESVLAWDGVDGLVGLSGGFQPTSAGSEHAGTGGGSTGGGSLATAGAAYRGVAGPPGERVLLYTYVRRSQQPAVERRYTLVLPDRAEVQAIHADLLQEIAAAPRAYGETLLVPPLGVAAVERLAPWVRRSTVVEMRRWTTEWLAAALADAGFAQVRTTAHPGELGRHFARALLAAGTLAPFAPEFTAATQALGQMAGAIPGRAMVTAIR